MATDTPASVTQTNRDDELVDVFFRKAHWNGAFDVTVLRLAQAIRLGALKAGSRLPPERELVSRLGVSRTTLREAARTLQQEGYLETSRGRTGGTFVTAREDKAPSGPQARRLALRMGRTLFDLMDLRSAVESKSAELAALRADKRDIERLSSLVVRSKEAPLSKRRKTDSALHITIAWTANSDLLLDAVLDEQMRLHELLAFLSLTRTPEPAARHSSLQHGQIVDLIAKGDAPGARVAMEEHIAGTNEQLMQVLKISR